MKARLKDLGTIFTGNTPSKRVDEYWDNSDIKFIKPDIIKDELCVIYSANEYISAGAKNASRIVPANSVLVTCIGNIGRVGITEEEVAFNQQINAIVPNRTIIPKYLAYAIYANRKQLQAIANAPVVPIINKTQFSDFEISICESLEKQNKIVRILDTISEIITHNKKKIEALDNLIKARFVEMFGENDATSKVLIGDAVELINGRAFKPTDWTPTGLPIIRIQNLNDTKAPYNYFYGAYDKKNYIKSGELLFSWSGTPGTSFGAFIWNRGPGLLNQHIFRVLPKKDYDLNFLRFALNAQLDEIISKAHGGVGLQHITKSELEKIAIPYPNRKLQAAFSAFVAQIDKSKFALQNNIKSLMNLWYNINQYVCERTYGEA